MRNGKGMSRWLVAGVSALLLGILGMHALGVHGVAADAPRASHGVSAAPLQETQPHGPQVRGLAPAPVGDHTTPTLHPAEGDSSHGLHAVAELCLAILVAGLLGLGALSAVRRRRPWRIHRTRCGSLDAVLRPPLWVSSGPPYEWAFSVIRC